MKSKKSIILIILGIIGALLVSTYDIIMQKPVNDITGPKSIAGFIISGIFIISGVMLIIKKQQ